MAAAAAIKTSPCQRKRSSRSHIPVESRIAYASSSSNASGSVTAVSFTSSAAPNSAADATRRASPSCRFGARSHITMLAR